MRLAFKASDRPLSQLRGTVRDKLWKASTRDVKEICNFRYDENVGPLRRDLWPRRKKRGLPPADSRDHVTCWPWRELGQYSAIRQAKGFRQQGQFGWLDRVVE